ncbi:histone H1-III-like [Ctenocephalides felis]|uniref:histone H1-III-like n=1 Tax=Ctenocephalides felis TaxID=7515 RepID=UPI000E6E1578|nr:histone H1-III-like [Ctenocephalides felis]
MVNNAIKSLKERGGSSLQAIKKYMSANYKIDAEKMSTFIKKYLKSAVQAGTLIQTKGKGASGSFKLAANAKQSGGESGVSAGKARTAKTPAAKAKSKTAKSKGAAKPASSLKRSLHPQRAH